MLLYHSKTSNTKIIARYHLYRVYTRMYTHMYTTSTVYHTCATCHAHMTYMLYDSYIHTYIRTTVPHVSTWYTYYRCSSSTGAHFSSLRQGYILPDLPIINHPCSSVFSTASSCRSSTTTSTFPSSTGRRGTLNTKVRPFRSKARHFPLPQLACNI
jgi:hypothetical protein